MTDTVGIIPKRKISKKRLLLMASPLIVVTAIVVGSLLVMRHLQGSRNNTRRSNINKVNDSLQLYSVHSGSFPSLANLNDTKWLAINMPDIKPSQLKDPRGDGKVLPQPTAHNYAYSAFALDGKNPCDNKATSCFSYTLTATLEGGGTYTKSSLSN